MLSGKTFLESLSGLALTFGALGLIGLATSVFVTCRFIRNAEKADGVIVGCVTNRAEGESLTYRPRVSFVTPKGTKILFDANWSSTEQRFQSGEILPVLFRRDDPQDARIADFMSIWGLPCLIGALSTASFLLFALLRWFEQRPRRLVQDPHSQG